MNPKTQVGQHVGITYYGCFFQYPGLRKFFYHFGSKSLILKIHLTPKSSLKFFERKPFISLLGKSCSFPNESKAFKSKLNVSVYIERFSISFTTSSLAQEAIIVIENNNR